MHIMPIGTQIEFLPNNLIHLEQHSTYGIYWSVRSKYRTMIQVQTHHMPSNSISCILKWSLPSLISDKPIKEQFYFRAANSCKLCFQVFVCAPLKKYWSENRVIRTTVFAPPHSYWGSVMSSQAIWRTNLQGHDLLLVGWMCRRCGQQAGKSARSLPFLRIWLSNSKFSRVGVSTGGHRFLRVWFVDNFFFALFLFQIFKQCQVVFQV